MCDLEQWQPDWVLILNEIWRRAIIDLCSPSDIHSDQFKVVAICKQEGYSPLVLALGQYLDDCWTVHLYQWVVGNHSLIETSHINVLVVFLGTPSKCSKAAVEHTVLAFVKAIYFMHQVSYGSMHGRKHAADKQLNSISSLSAFQQLKSC